MKCPVCGAAELIKDTRNVPCTYKGKPTIIQTVTGDFCPACNEVILDREQGDRFMREMRNAHEAQKHSDWLREKTAISLTDVRSNVSHEQVVDKAQAIIDTKRI